MNDIDPDTGERFARADRERVLASRYLALARQTFAEQWGPFQEEALALTMRLALAGGDETLADQAEAELLQRFPKSVTAREIREAETEE